MKINFNDLPTTRIVKHGTHEIESLRLRGLNDKLTLMFVVGEYFDNFLDLEVYVTFPSEDIDTDNRKGWKIECLAIDIRTGHDRDCRVDCADPILDAYFDFIANKNLTV